MTSNYFSPQAQLFWNGVSDFGKQKILTCVWCVDCRHTITMINFDGTVEGTTLVLRGKCGSCSHAVVRVVESDC